MILAPAQRDAAGVMAWALFDAPVLAYRIQGGAAADLGVPVFTASPSSVLRVAFFPVLAMVAGLPDWSACHVGVEVVTGSGTHTLVDQHGHPFDPDSVGCAVADQWNLLDLDLTPIAGETVVEVRLVGAPDYNGAHGWLQVVGVLDVPDEPTDVVDLVSTSRGSNSHRGFSRGNTFPGTCVPHGMHFLTPVTDARTRQWLYTWQPDKRGRTALAALAFAHQPSPWINDRQAFQLMPWTGRAHVDPRKRALDFSHDDELDRPHHYRVRFAEGTVAEMTPTCRAAVFRFTFDALCDDTARGVILDQPFAGRTDVRILPDGRAAITAAIAPHQGWRSRWPTPSAYVYGETTQAVRLVDGRRPRATTLALLGGDVLEVKLAMSFLSVEQARRTLADEVGDADFDVIRERAHDEWASLLSRLEVDGTPDQRRTAYSAFARLHCWPNVAHEVVYGEEVHASPFLRPGHSTEAQTGCVVVGGPLHVNNGYWDTYRTSWPAYSLFTPDLASGLVEGNLQHFREGGWTARWSGPGYIDCMVGTSSDTVYASASAHGITFDEVTAYDSALRNACVPSPDPHVGRTGIGRGRFRGPIDTDTPEALSWTLDNAQGDDSIARWSATLAERADDLGVGERRAEFEANAVWFANRALAHHDVFEPRTGFFLGRRPDGRWRIDPEALDPRDWGGDYVETNAWGMAFASPHDPGGLARLLGGESVLADRLEAHLRLPETGRHAGWYLSSMHEITEARSLRLGMLGMSNQPAHHVPFMFAAAGRPWRTQDLTRECLDRLFVGGEIGQGFPGDEDNGEMSAWWLLAATGLYPLLPASGEYVITAPLVQRMVWRRYAGDLTVLASGVGAESAALPRFIQSMRVNGRPWDHVTIPTALLMSEVTIDVELGSEPSAWGSASRPMSASDRSARRPDLSDVAELTLTSRGAITAPSSLLDDEGGRVVEIPAGSSLTLSWAESVRPAFFTLTSDDTTDPEWRLEALSDAWRPLDVASRAPRDANQTQAWLMPPDDVRALRWTFPTATTLRQVEVY